MLDYMTRHDGLEGQEKKATRRMACRMQKGSYEDEGRCVPLTPSPMAAMSDCSSVF